MKEFRFQFPSSRAEFQSLIKSVLLDYYNMATLIGVLTVFSLAWNFHINDAEQFYQWSTLLLALLIYLYFAFTIFVAKAAEKVGRRWWIWMITSYFFPFIGILAVIIFKTSKSTSNLKPEPTSKSVDSMFFLPSVRSKECVEVFLPKKSIFPMSNLRWIEIQFSQNQNQDYWVNKISESESFFSSKIDIGELTASIARAGCEADDFEPDEEAWLTLFVLAKFGLLAGMFERESTTTNERDCHPLPWNALKFYSMGISKEDEKPFGEDHRMLLTHMVYAGYLMGKLNNPNPDYIFSQWNS